MDLQDGTNTIYAETTIIAQAIYLNKEVCSQYDIFRCSKSVAAIYVSNKIKEIVEENNWIGFEFYEQP